MSSSEAVGPCRAYVSNKSFHLLSHHNFLCYLKSYEWNDYERNHPTHNYTSLYYIICVPQAIRNLGPGDPFWGPPLGTPSTPTTHRYIYYMYTGHGFRVPKITVFDRFLSKIRRFLTIFGGRTPQNHPKSAIFHEGPPWAWGTPKKGSRG